MKSGEISLPFWEATPFTSILIISEGLKSRAPFLTRPPYCEDIFSHGQKEETYHSATDANNAAVAGGVV